MVCKVLLNLLVEVVDLAAEMMALLNTSCDEMYILRYKKCPQRQKEVENDLKSSTISHLSGIRVCHVACHSIVVTQLHTHTQRQRRREREATDLGHGSSSELLQAFSISRPIPISFRKALSLSHSL